MPNTNLESLAIGADNVDTDAAGNAAHAFLLYLCDANGKKITRVDPASPGTTQEVASGLTITPICGRSFATGDFTVTDKFGPGVYQLIAHIGINTVPVANVPFSAAAIGATAVQIDTFAGMKGRGLTQKYIGDLLVVDDFNNQVLHSVYGGPPLFTTLSPFITTNLSSPAGVANLPSLRNEAVSNIAPTVTHNGVLAVSLFDSTGAPATACPFLTFPRHTTDVPAYLASAPVVISNVVQDIVLLVTDAGNLWTWTTDQAALASPTCGLTIAASTPSGVPLSGVAVAPARVTLTLPETATAADPTPTIFDFRSTQFWYTATGCNATVTAYPRSLATINSMIGLAGFGGPPPTQFPAVNLDGEGFETAYEAFNPTCMSVFPDGGFPVFISNFVDPSQSTNPRGLDCHDTDPATEPQLVGGLTPTSCVVMPTLKVYPLGGPIPGDISYVGSGTKTNFFALVNENAGAGTAEPGRFCGYQNPLLNPTDPGYPFSFVQGSRNTINVKFKLATAGSDCNGQSFITNASALISVAQIAPTFNAINVQATSSSLDLIPLYNEGNAQYSFTLNVFHLLPGTYSLTTTFLSDNTTNQTIKFVVTPATP